MAGEKLLRAAVSWAVVLGEAACSRVNFEAAMDSARSALVKARVGDRFLPVM